MVRHDGKSVIFAEKWLIVALSPVVFLRASIYDGKLPISAVM
jgi:hypothetical protein